MRPTQAALDQAESRPRKLSAADPSTLPSDRLSATPSTFFLSRDAESSQSPTERRGSSRLVTEAVSSLQDFIDDTGSASKPTQHIVDGRRSGSRRRSTIRPTTFDRSRRESSADRHSHTQEPIERVVTPSPLPSMATSLPESPQSLSSRSVPRSDEGGISDDTSSQAVVSSEDDAEAGDPPPLIQNSQPELIMPSIKMPSRRPFTERGKRLGKFKILVAGSKCKSSTDSVEQADSYSIRQDISYQVHCASLRRHRSC